MKSTILVLDAATTYNLITIDDVLLQLQITDPSVEDIALLEKQIAGVSAAIAKYCDRVFPSERVEETLWQPVDAHGLRRGYYAYGPWDSFWRQACVNSLYLKRYPITNIDSVYVDGIALTSDSNDTLLRIDRDNGVLYNLSDGYPVVWNFGKAVVATYTGGYTTIPEDLQFVALKMTESAWFTAAQDSTIKSEQVYGIASVTYGSTTSGTSSGNVSANGIPTEFKLLLEPYIRRWGFA